MARQYKAFISYSWADKDWGAWAHRALETYQTPKVLHGKQGRHGAVPQRLNPIFKDREEEAAGHGIGAAIEEALDHSEFLIVLCSPHSANSQWVNREVAYFKKHRDPKKILALIVEGEPGVSLSPGKHGNECFPKTLLFKVDDNLQPTEELEDVPLAADARKAGDGKRIAKLKIAAAMLGLGLDDLLKRDDRRRAKRRRWAMGVMGLISASMAGLAFVAMDQRDFARKQLQIAEKRLERSEGLAEFMVSDMRKKLDAVGRLDILDATAQRALAYYEDQSPEGLTPDQLGRRARAMLLFGEVHNSRGNLEAALAAYQKAAATTKEQLRRAPDNEQRIFDHSQSVFWVGFIAWQKGDTEAAHSYLTQYHNYGTQLVTLNPNNDNWQLELMYAHSNLGTLARDEGDIKAAEMHFRKALGISELLLKNDPQNLTLIMEVGVSHSWLADLQYLQTNLSGARQALQSEIDLYTQNVKDLEGHALLREHLVVAYYSLAQAELSSNRLPSALRNAEESVRIAESLLQLDPSSTTYIDRASYAQSIRADVLLHMGSLETARDAIETATRLANQLVAINSSVKNWHGDVVAQATLTLAHLEEHVGNYHAASAYYESCESILRELIDRDVIGRKIILRYSQAIGGKLRSNEGEDREWSRIIELIEHSIDQHGPEGKLILAEAYINERRFKEADDIINSLYHAGYRHPRFRALVKGNEGLLETNYTDI